MSSSTLLRQVMTQPELLGLILECLPQLDLLLAQSACKAWHTLIQVDTRLQAALFFGPRPTSDADADQFVLNPLLLQHFRMFFDNGQHAIQGPSYDYFFTPWSSLTWYRDMFVPDADHPLSPKRLTSDRFARPEASWRRILPCQPAPNELQLCFFKHVQEVEPVDTFQAFKPPYTNPPNKSAFVTFGILYDIIEQSWFRRLGLNSDNPRYTIYNLRVESFRVFFSHPKAPQSPHTYLPTIEKLTSDGDLSHIPYRTVGSTDSIVVILCAPDRNSEVCRRTWWNSGPRPTHEQSYAFGNRGSEIKWLHWDVEMHF